MHADYTLVVDTALTAKKLGATHFVVISSLGANAGSPFFYNKVKGKMEEALIAQKWEQLTIVRPSMLLGHRMNAVLTNRFSRLCSASCRVTGNPLRQRTWRVRC